VEHPGDILAFDPKDRAGGVAGRHGVDRYEDDAVGYLERAAGAPMHVTRVTLRPRVVFSAEPPDADALRDLHDQAHKGCFIANSVKTVVTVEPA
jgi:organic hydroperoxide reductase OsmC/OhrA